MRGSSSGERQRLPWLVAASTRLYRLLLVVYPASFRRAFGHQMAQVFRDACRDAYAGSGGPGVLALWLSTLADVARSATQEHADHLTQLLSIRSIRPTPALATAPLSRAATTWRSPMSHPASMLKRLSLRAVLVGGANAPYVPMPLPDRFTERARHALRLADTEARALGHNYIGTEHVLLGLLVEGDGIAAQVLRELGVSNAAARDRVLFIIGQGHHVVGDASMQDIGLTPRAALVMSLASAEAFALRHPFIDTEHLLLGLIREGVGIAAGVLDSLGVRLDDARERTLRILRDSAGNGDDRADEGDAQ